MMQTVIGTCPLCDAPGGTSMREIEYAEVWSRMRSDWGVDFSDSVRTNIPGETCSLVRCERCGLERFEPMAPGSPDFYAELMTATPYAADRWDFALARTLIGPGLDVVDFGCGEGRFLSSLGPRAGRTVGVDHNLNGIEAIVGRGGEAYASSFEAFAAAEEASFDVVTTFHTMEHIRDPMTMVGAAARCLRPRGWLMISVPNRERAWKQEGEPMDRPPHHVTRWGPDQLRALASHAGLVLDALRFEPPDLSIARALQERTLEPRLRRLPGSSSALAAKLIARLTIRRRGHDRKAASDGYARRGIYGHTVAVVLRKPTPGDDPARTPGRAQPTDR
jgi:SAM-dependent methyltransferase